MSSEQTASIETLGIHAQCNITPCMRLWLETEIGAPSCATIMTSGDYSTLTGRSMGVILGYMSEI